MADLSDLADPREMDFQRRLLEAVAAGEDSGSLRFTRRSTPNPPPTLADLISKSNASLPVSSVTGTAPRTRYVPLDLTAGGYTITKGPLAGQTIVAGEKPSLDQVNTQAHEAYHQRALENGGMPRVHGLLGSADAGAVGNGYRFSLADLMRQFQAPDKNGPHWGLDPSSSAEEQIASIAGYEGMQPKGTAIADTPFGKELAKNRLLDYYLNQSSIPYGGVWEGQSPPTSTAQKFIDALKRGFVKGGFNTVNR